MASLRENSLYVEDGPCKLLLKGLDVSNSGNDARHLVHVVEIDGTTYASATDGVTCHLVRVEKVEAEGGSFVFLKAREQFFIRVVDTLSLARFREGVVKAIGGYLHDERNKQYHLTWWSEMSVRGSVKAYLGTNGSEDEVVLRGLELYTRPEGCWVIDYQYIKPLRMAVSNVLRARDPEDLRPLIFGTPDLCAVVMPINHRYPKG